MFLLLSIKPQKVPDFSSKIQRSFSFLKKCYKNNQRFDFSDVICTTSKNELKIIWLSRHTKVLDSFPPLFRNAKLMLVLCDQVTQYLGSLTISPVSTTSMKGVPTQEAKELWITQDCTHSQHSKCELQHMHIFLPETD